MFKKIKEKIKVRRKARHLKERLSEQEELIFLGCANDWLIERYIHEFAFCRETEIKLLELCSNEVVAYYLHRHIVCSELECKILDEEYLACIYLHQHTFGNEAQRKILKPKYAKLLDIFVDEGYSFGDEEETFFARVASDELIEKYIQRRSVLPESIKILAKRNSKWLVFHAKRHYLPKHLEADFIKAASLEDFEEYIEDNSFSVEGCLYLVENCDEERLKKYISKHPLVDESDDSRAEVKFFQTANDDMLAYYLEHNSDDVSEEAEKVLLLTKNEKLIKFYIDKNTLYDSNVELLIEGDNDEIFKYYIKNYTLSWEHECMLIRSKNQIRLYCYLGRRRFSPDAEKLLILSDDKDLITAYYKNWQFYESSWKTLLEKFFIDNL